MSNRTTFRLTNHRYAVFKGFVAKINASPSDGIFPRFASDTLDERKLGENEIRGLVAHIKYGGRQEGLLSWPGI